MADFTHKPAFVARTPGLNAPPSSGASPGAPHRDIVLLQTEEHIALRLLFASVAANVSPEGEGSLTDELMKQLVDELKIHFRLEEVDGVFDQVERDAPQLSHEVHQLRVEHVELLDEAENLVRLSQKVADPAMRRQFQHLFQRFRDRMAYHESQENSVVQRAYCDDLGSED
jgi:hemerythrin HHE cation binding domain-containing protein